MDPERRFTWLPDTASLRPSRPWSLGEIYGTMVMGWDDSMDWFCWENCDRKAMGFYH